jgi:hypothetical protein
MSAVKMQDDGEELRICIDGKQRLTSIRRYAPSFFFSIF